MNLDIVGQSIGLIVLDYAVSLRTDGQVDNGGVLKDVGEVNIRIGNSFSIRSPSGDVVDVDPERLGPGLGHLGFILRQTVTSAVVQDAGTLVLDFANGARLEVAADDEYEAWTLAGSHGEKVVVGPGGVISIWDRTD